jgi:hypothetical protein
MIQEITKEFGDLTLREWGAMCETHYICDDTTAHAGFNNCVNCPLEPFTNHGDDCPMWDDNHHRDFKKPITFTLNPDRKVEDEE